MPIKQVKKLVNNEVRKLVRYQSGDINPVVTGRPQIDTTLGGLLPGDIVVIAGASGAGKTFELQTIRENVMNKDLNPTSENFVFLDYSFEMKLFNLVLRGLNKQIEGKTKREILLEQFTEEEKELAGRYMDTLRDDRYYIEEETCTPSQFYKQTKEFLQENSEKEAVIIAIDHMALFKNEGGEKKGTIDAAVEYVNQLKREFDNAYFIILTQLNRGILGRIKDKDINAAPNRSDVYQSDTMFHIADYLIVVHNPHRLGISEYLRVNPTTYHALSEHFTAPIGSTNRVAFNTLGRIFYHILKVREEDILFQDIYIEAIDLPNLALYEEEDLDIMNTPFDEVDFGELEEGPEF